jgi:UDP-apiose/xylose synthase
MDYLPGVDGQGIPRVLACFMNALLRGQPLKLVGGGTQRRAFMDVSDMVEAVCRIVARPAQTRGQVLNLGNPHNDVSIAELAARLAEEYGALVPDAALAKFVHISAEEFYGPGYADTFERVPDISKARELLDWEPRRSLAEMLPAIVRDYVERYGHRVRAELEPESTRIAELEPESARIASGA